MLSKLKQGCVLRKETRGHLSQDTSTVWGFGKQGSPATNHTQPLSTYPGIGSDMLNTNFKKSIVETRDSRNSLFS